MSGTKRTGKSLIVLAALLAFSIGFWGTENADAAGTLTPTRSVGQPIRIRDHQVHVTINNGFAVTEVVQTFSIPTIKTSRRSTPFLCRRAPASLK